jgi:hypothetical protein
VGGGREGTLLLSRVSSLISSASNLAATPARLRGGHTTINYTWGAARRLKNWHGACDQACAEHARTRIFWDHAHDSLGDSTHRHGRCWGPSEGRGGRGLSAYRFSYRLIDRKPI